MIRRLHAELVLDAAAAIAEGPAWDAATGTLLWVDIKGFTAHRFDPETARDEAMAFDSYVSAIVPHAEGGYLAAVHSGFARVREWGAVPELLAEVAGGGIRMNDGECAPDGAFWAGTMGLEKEPGVGALYRLDPDGTVTVELDGVTISNGLAFAGNRLYYVDTPTLRVDLFDIESHMLVRRRPFVAFPEHGLQRPDGITLDDEGCLWVALFMAGEVHRYTPDGVLDTVIEVPVHHPTSCAFGGRDGATLFITSATAPPGRSTTPHDGGLFAVRPGVSGPPARPYGRSTVHVT